MQLIYSSDTNSIDYLSHKKWVLNSFLPYIETLKITFVSGVKKPYNREKIWSWRLKETAYHKTVFWICLILILLSVCQRILKIQECIPVGCVPPAYWSYPSMHCGGGCTFLGGCTCPVGCRVYLPGGCTCPGVYLPRYSPPWTDRHV